MDSSSASKTERFAAEIIQNLQVIRVDIGSRLIGTSVKVEVSLKNTLNHDLDLDLKPSCNCTGLSISKMRAVKSETIVISPQVRLPASPQAFSSSVQFIDPQKSISFTLVVEANVIDAVSIEPSPLLIDQSASPFSTTISVLPAIPDLKIIKVESDSQRFRLVENKELEPSKHMVAIQPSDTTNRLEESFAIRVTYEMGATMDPITRDFYLTVRYTDRVSIGPRVSTWKLENGRYRARMYLLGASPERYFDQGKISLTNGKVKIPVHSEKLTNRADKAVIFEASIEQQELPTVEENKPWRIEIEGLQYFASSQIIFEESK